MHLEAFDAAPPRLEVEKVKGGRDQGRGMARSWLSTWASSSTTRTGTSSTPRRPCFAPRPACTFDRATHRDARREPAARAGPARAGPRLVQQTQTPGSWHASSTVASRPGRSRQPRAGQLGALAGRWPSGSNAPSAPEEGGDCTWPSAWTESRLSIETGLGAWTSWSARTTRRASPWHRLGHRQRCLRRPRGPGRPCSRPCSPGPEPGRAERVATAAARC